MVGRLLVNSLLLKSGCPQFFGIVFGIRKRPKSEWISLCDVRSVVSGDIEDKTTNDAADYKTGRTYEGIGRTDERTERHDALGKANLDG